MAGLTVNLRWGDIAPALSNSQQIALADILWSLRNTYADPAAEIRAQESEGFRPRPSYKRWPLGNRVDWSADPFRDVHWRFHLSAFRPATPYLMDFEQGQQRESLVKAYRLMIDWIEFHIVEQKPNDFAWYNMSTGQRAAQFVYILCQLARTGWSFPDNQRPRLAKCLSAHIEHLTNREELSLGNHGLFQTHGLMALARLFPSTSLGETLVRQANAQMTHLIGLQFNEEGGHLEHSPAYHFFGENVIEKFLNTGWYKEEAVAKLSRTTESVGRWMCRPDGSMVTIGDSPPNRRVMASPSENPASFLASPHPSANLKHLAQTGYSIVRSSGDAPDEAAFMLFMMGAHHSAVHKHSDDLCLEWMDAGQPLLTDSGFYSYKRDRMRVFVLSTAAHNTVEADGKSSIRLAQHAYGSCLSEPVISKNGVEFGGSVDHRTLGFRHERRLFYAPGRYLVVCDTLTGEVPKSYVQRWHFSPALDLAETRDGFWAHGNGISFDIRTSADVRDAEIARGQVLPALQGWVCTGDSTMSPRWSLGLRDIGRHAVISTSFALSELAEADQVRERMHREAKMSLANRGP